MFRKVVIAPLAFHLAVIAPAFSDVIPQDFNYKGTLNEFTLMDDVPSSRTIIDLRRAQNILERRDASCDLIYKKVFNASTRKVSVEELYAATQFCRVEFYQGALKDWEGRDPLFGDKILPYFQQAVNTDIASNSYFGDIERATAPTDAFSVSKFDGVFKWIKKYIAANIIPADQTMTIAGGTDFKGAGGPAAAAALLKSMYNAQPVLMNAWPDAEKAFYVSKEIAQAYKDYLTATAASGGFIDLIINGVPTKQLAYQGIPILVEELWTPIITQIKGSTGYAAVLTIRNNFVFATDKNYGGGPNGDQALRVFWNDVTETWHYVVYLKAGTQIALPEYVIVAMSAFS